MTELVMNLTRTHARCLTWIVAIMGGSFISIVSLMPTAAGPFVPDAFTNTYYGRGITWGLCHNTWAGTRGKGHSVLMRFDCDLSLDVDDPDMKRHGHVYKPDFYYGHGLNERQRRRILEANRELRDK